MLGRDVIGDLLEEDLEVLRLRHQDQDVRETAGLGVVQRSRDTVPLGQLLRALLTTARHEDLVGGAPAGAEQPGDERFGHPAAAEECDRTIRHRALNRFERKNHTLAGRSASRRVRYGYHSVPYGM